MIGRALTDKRGATALEFALVCPIFLIGGLAACAFGLFAWQQSVLDAVAAETARCAAIASSDCAATRTGCSDRDAVACYALTRARTLGLDDLHLDKVVLTQETLPDDLAVATVAISHSSSIAGYSVTLSASASFPRS